MYPRKNEEASVECLTQGMIIFLSVTFWLPFIQLSLYAKPGSAIKSIDRTYADTRQNQDICEIHKTFLTLVLWLNPAKSALHLVLPTRPESSDESRLSPAILTLLFDYLTTASFCCLLTLLLPILQQPWIFSQFVYSSFHFLAFVRGTCNV